MVDEQLLDHLAKQISNEKELVDINNSNFGITEANSEKYKVLLFKKAGWNLIYGLDGTSHCLKLF